MSVNNLSGYISPNPNRTTEPTNDDGVPSLLSDETPTGGGLDNRDPLLTWAGIISQAVLTYICPCSGEGVKNLDKIIKKVSLKSVRHEIVKTILINNSIPNNIACCITGAVTMVLCNLIKDSANKSNNSETGIAHDYLLKNVKTGA